MRLRFYPQDPHFKGNLCQLRDAVIRRQPYAPARVDVCLTEGDDIRIVAASMACIRPDGRFAYSNKSAECRVALDAIRWVEAWWEAP